MESAEDAIFVKGVILEGMRGFRWIICLYTLAALRERDIEKRGNRKLPRKRRLCESAQPDFRTY